jgi:hypothetical protein
MSLGDFIKRLLGRDQSDSSDEIVFAPDSPDLPTLWNRNEGSRAKSNLAVLDGASTDTLQSLCDGYWNSFLDEEKSDDDSTVIRDGNIPIRALEILKMRGAEVLPWARERLTHRGYDAREHAAWLIGELAAKGLLGSERDAVAKQLAELATRPWEEDPKEIQANDSAVMALRRIGGPICISTLKKILVSPEWDQDDLQWNAAEMLSEVVGQPFMQSEDPVRAAKEWAKNSK